MSDIVVEDVYTWQEYPGWAFYRSYIPAILVYHNPTRAKKSKLELVVACHEDGRVVSVVARACEFVAMLELFDSIDRVNKS